MARVTVEDCVEKVPNRFSLVLLAAHRARAISAGAPLMVDRDNDKNPVVSLREIADDVVDADDLRENLIGTLQRFIEIVPGDQQCHAGGEAQIIDLHAHWLGLGEGFAQALAAGGELISIGIGQ